MIYLYIIIATYVLNVLDMIFTMKLVSDYGLDIEANPIGKLMLKNNSVTVVCKLIFVAVGLIALYVMREFLIARIVLIAMLAIYVVLTLYHLIIRIYLRKNNL